MPTNGRDFEALLLEAQAGLAEALGHLLQAYRRHLVLTARRSLDPALGRKISPSDLVQETLFRAGREFAAFGGKTEGELQAWLGAILKNLTTNFVEQYKYTQKRSLGREVCSMTGTQPAICANSWLSIRRRQGRGPRQSRSGSGWRWRSRGCRRSSRSPTRQIDASSAGTAVPGGE